jgi:hypothetical protein
MTNKMPVVGKIYKTKKGKVYLGHKDSEVLGVNKGLVWYFQDPTIFSYEKREYYHYEIVTIDRFWRTHEELIGTYTININAEKTVMSKEEPKIDMKEERVDPVSIWKDVNELPPEFNNYIVRGKNKNAFLIKDVSAIDEFVKSPYGKEFTTLTNLINSFEQMQKDIEELKQK